MTTSAPGPAGVAAVTTNFVDLSDAINPPPLNGPFFIAYRAASSIMYSALADGAALAVRARFPSVAPSDAFPYLGQDRTVYNGFAEPIASYSLRLQQWLDLLAYEGLPTGMMCALLGYCIPATWTALSPGTSCLVRTVDDSSNWNSYAAGANPVPLGALNNPFPVSVPISSVVNNAGLSISKSLQDTTVEDWDRQHSVMARGSFLVSQAAAMKLGFPSVIAPTITTGMG